MNPLNAYKNASVNTASPGRLLIMLYDTLLRYLDQGKMAIDSGDIETANRSMIRCQDIVLELRSTLNHDVAPDLCSNLEGVYTFMYTKFVNANTAKDASHLDEIRPLIFELRDAFQSADRQVTEEKRG